ncbi:MAG: DNA polymerase III subunit delta [Desulfuromonadales bacterium]|nr:DNA polymerase III subunit delta [Desulfuromonadales bacterium]
MKPDELEKSIKQGSFGSLYFLYGDEEYLVERGVQQLLDVAVSEEFKDFNFSIFYGNECKGEEIVDSAVTLPMFADRRVVLVKRADELSAPALEHLLPYIENPSPDSCLIFQAGKIDQRRKFFSELKKRDLLVEYKRLNDGQLAGFIRREAESRKKRIDSAAAELLVYYVGNNLRELVTQLDKLVTFVGARERVTVEDVQQMVSDTKVDSVFEFANALGYRDSDKAIRRLQTVLREKDALFPLIGALARHFRQLAMVREAMDKGASKDVISKQVKINPYFLSGVMEQAGKFRQEEFVEVFSKLYEVDFAMKSGGKPQLLLEMLVLSICKQIV